MKGVYEINWTILLIIIGGIIAFLIIVGFSYDAQKKIIDWVQTFKASDLLTQWQKVLKK